MINPPNANDALALLGEIFNGCFSSRRVSRSRCLIFPSFFWGYLKAKLYATKPNVTQEVNDEITRHIKVTELQSIRLKKDTGREVCPSWPAFGRHFV